MAIGFRKLNEAREKAGLSPIPELPVDQASTPVSKPDDWRGLLMAAMIFAGSTIGCVALGLVILGVLTLLLHVPELWARDPSIVMVASLVFGAILSGLMMFAFSAFIALPCGITAGIGFFFCGVLAVGMRMPAWVMLPLGAICGSLGASYWNRPFGSHSANLIGAATGFVSAALLLYLPAFRELSAPFRRVQSGSDAPE